MSTAWCNHIYFHIDRISLISSVIFLYEEKLNCGGACQDVSPTQI